MRVLWLACLLALPASACGQSQNGADIPEPRVKPASQSALEDNQPDINDNRPEPEIVRKGPFRILGCNGVIEQGGAVLCHTLPNQKVKIGRSSKDFYYEQADENGDILIGFDRDEKRAIIDLGEGGRFDYDFETRSYDVSHVKGLPPSQVGNYTEEQLVRIRASSARKKQGFASRSDFLGFKNGFIHPVKDYRKTTNFGAFRTPHMGVDMAAPLGTPIYAPADGVVSMADNDLYFEGAMVLLDHGQGLISMYLHVNEILVKPSNRVSRLRPLGRAGARPARICAGVLNGATAILIPNF